MAVNRLRVTGPISASNEPNDLAIVACLREYGQIVGTGLQIPDFVRYNLFLPDQEFFGPIRIRTFEK